MSDMSDTQILNGLIKEVSSFFGATASKVKEEIEKWTVTLFRLRVAKMTANNDQIAKLEKSEQYAWDAIAALKAEHAEESQKQAWVFVEKLLVTLKKVILTTV